MVESAYSMIPFSHLSLLSLKHQVSHLKMKMPKFFELLKIVKDCPAGGRSKTFPITPVHFGVFRGNPESHGGKVLELRIVEV